MAIPSVMQGLIETEDGKVFELDSPKGAAWLDTIGSFRYEPTGDGKPYTVRKEASAYWYGCRKVAGKVRKKYIGKSSEVSVAKLEEIAEALEVPPEPRVNKVAEVAEGVAQVAQSAQVTEQVAESRVIALESQVAELLKTVKDIQEALPGKSESGNSVELPKVDNEVAEQLQNELGNLKAENEALKQELEKVKYDYSTLVIIDKQLNQQVEEVRSQLETEKTRWDELREELDDREETCGELRSELADLKQKSASASEPPEKTLPDALTILNYLRGKRKKSTVTLDDVKAMLELINKS